MICAACGEATDVGATCTACGESPLLRGWTLHEVVGRGSAGITYRATRGDERAAVKELPLRRADTLKALELFKREARVLERLEHPGVARHIEHFVEGEGRTAALYVLTEWVDGSTLAEHFEGHRYTPDEVLDLAAQVLDILAYLHRQTPPVLHRDLEPGNLLLNGKGRVVLVDFGAARDVLKDPDLGGSTVTGTFGYMAPEQFGGDASPGSDLYGLGALCALLLTRQPPRKLLVDGRLAWKKHTRVDPVTEALLDSLLAFDPAKRAKDAQAVRDWLDRARSGKQLPVPGALPSPREPRDIGPFQPGFVGTFTFVPIVLGTAGLGTLLIIIGAVAVFLM